MKIGVKEGKLKEDNKGLKVKHKMAPATTPNQTEKYWGNMKEEGNHKVQEEDKK